MRGKKGILLLTLFLFLFGGCKEKEKLKKEDIIFEEGYVSYENEALHYIVPYPSLFQKTEDTDDGRGAYFEGPQKDASLYITGGQNEDAQNADQLMEKAEKEIKNLTGSTILFQYFDDNLYHIRYETKDGELHFVCGFVYEDTMITFLLSYPKEEEGYFEEVIGYMAGQMVRVNLAVQYGIQK